MPNQIILNNTSPILAANSQLLLLGQFRRLYRSSAGPMTAALVDCLNWSTFSRNLAQCRPYTKPIVTWRVDIQKGVTHNFSKIVFLAKKVLEVNANTIPQTIFFFHSEIFLFSTWKSKICISRCTGDQKGVSRHYLLWEIRVFFLASGCFVIFVQIVVSSVIIE